MPRELNAQLVEAVQKSWAIVATNLKENGVQFFLRFFRENPTYKDMFKPFQGISLEELAEHPKLRAHASIVFHNLASVITNLQDKECAVVIVHKIVSDHIPRNVRLEHFQNLFKTLAGFLADKLGSDFSGDTKEGWLAVVDLMTTIISDELKQLGA